MLCKLGCVVYTELCCVNWAVLCKLGRWATTALTVNSIITDYIFYNTFLVLCALSLNVFSVHQNVTDTILNLYKQHKLVNARSYICISVNRKHRFYMPIFKQNHVFFLLHFFSSKINTISAIINKHSDSNH